MYLHIKHIDGKESRHRVADPLAAESLLARISCCQQKKGRQFGIHYTAQVEFQAPVQIREVKQLPGTTQLAIR